MLVVPAVEPGALLSTLSMGTLLKIGGQTAANTSMSKQYNTNVLDAFKGSVITTRVILTR